MDEQSFLLRRGIVRVLRQYGEVGATWITSTANLGRRHMNSAEVHAELKRMVADGLVSERRSVEPVRHGSRFTREFRYYSLRGRSHVDV